MINDNPSLILFYEYYIKIKYSEILFIATLHLYE